MNFVPTPAIRTAFAVFVVAAIGIALRGALPLPTKPIDAPPTEFSGERALAHSRKFAIEPRGRGGAAAARGRDYLARACEELGLEVQIHRDPINHGRGVTFVENVIARIPGTENKNTIGLTAHYDSVAWGPGAADDGAGCVVMLEAARALMCMPRYKNDIVFVFTGDEEGGGNGSVNSLSHPWLKDLNIMIGLEARGDWGTPYMFETSHGNLPLLEEMAKMDIPAVSNSIMYQAHHQTPNTTDFTHMVDHGALGYNVAFVGGLGYYHTANDSAAHLSPDTLQHQGEYVMAILKHYGNDGPKISEAILGKDEKGNPIYEDAVYFNTLGHHLVVYSVTKERPFAIAAAVIFILAIITAFVTRSIRVTRVLGGLGIFLATIVITAAICGPLLFGSYKLFYVYIMYNAAYYHLAYILLGTALVVAFVSRFRNGIAPEEFHFAMLVVWALALSVAGSDWTSVAATKLLARLGTPEAHPWLSKIAAFETHLPVITYAFTWPLLIGSLGLGIACVLRRLGVRREASVAVLVLSALPPVFFLVPGMHALYHFGGAISPVGTAGLMIIVLMCLAPALQVIFANGAKRLAIGVAILSLVIFLAGWIVQLRPTAEKPKMNTLTYALNLDSNQAVWLTSDKHSDHWLEQFVPNEVREETQYNDIAPDRGETARRANAPVAKLPAPQVTVVSDATADNKRELVLHYVTTTSPEESRITVLGAHVLAASIDGVPGPLKTGDDVAFWSVNIEYLPHDGQLTLHLTLDATTPGPVDVRVMEDFFHLPELTTLGYRPRPDWMITRGNTLGWWEKDHLDPNHTYLTKTFRF